MLEAREGSDPSRQWASWAWVTSDDVVVIRFIHDKAARIGDVLDVVADSRVPVGVLRREASGYGIARAPVRSGRRRSASGMAMGNAGIEIEDAVAHDRVIVTDGPVEIRPWR
ncbi:hypothetical protein B5P44_13590 [Mycobacterium sp. CBMA 213]|nr:hypothetical protein [Mycolicibacterium sp. CBMA 213]